MRRLPALTTLAGILVCCATPPASAEVAAWRFCIASDFKTHVAYLTALFESSSSSKDLEGRVGEMLTEKQLSYEIVQCRAASDVIQSESDREDAQAFVKALGFRLQLLQ